MKNFLSEIEPISSTKMNNAEPEKKFNVSCPSCNTILDILRIGKWQCPVCKNDFDYDGEMQPDVALNPEYKASYPFSKIVALLAPRNTSITVPIASLSFNLEITESAF